MSDMRVTIKMVDNGVVVDACKSGDSPDGYQEETYIYKTLDEALKEVPAMFSVLKDGKMDKGEEAEKRTMSGKMADDKKNKMITPPKKK